jgi:acetyl esterase
MTNDRAATAPGGGRSDDVAMDDARDLDPDVRRFVSGMAESVARYPEFNTAGFPQVRRWAEEVRAPWRRGGPVMHATQDLVAPTRHGDVRLRIHRPRSGELPGLVYLHGGGWTLFSLDTHDRIMREYAARAGVVVVGVDYALSPEARFPVALEQVVAVTRWLHVHGARLGIDAERIALGGDSAGGNLSIGAALALRDAGDADRVAALLLIYPAFDNHCSEEALRRHGGPGAVLTGEEVEYFWGNYAGDADVSANPLACPIRARLEGLPPVCMTIPECDVLTEVALEMAKRMRAAAVPVEVTVYPGATHSFIEAVSISPLADRAIDDGARWLRATLAAGSQRG